MSTTNRTRTASERKSLIARLILKHGLQQDNRFDIAFALAWEEGHASGLGEVEQFFDGLVPLLKPEVRMFYRVNWDYKPNGHGVDALKLAQYLAPGRYIRVSSSGAEYGLFESIVIAGNNHMSDVNIVNVQTGKTAGVYIERVAEVCLTREEAGKLGFGYPL